VDGDLVFRQQELDIVKKYPAKIEGNFFFSYLNNVLKLEDKSNVTIDTSKFKFDLVLLSEVCKHSNGKPLKSTEKGDGQFNIMGGGIDYMGKHDKYNREANTISISKSGSAGYVKFHTEQFWAGDCFTVLPSTPKLLVKFLYYYLKTNEDFIKSKKTGSTIPHCKWEDVKNSRIPLPSLEIQKKIITELDLIQEEKDQAQRIINESEQKSKDRMASFLEY
jgi:restriction endonuclease S subunit